MLSDTINHVEHTHNVNLLLKIRVEAIFGIILGRHIKWGKRGLLGLMNDKYLLPSILYLNYRLKIDLHMDEYISWKW